MQPRPANCRLKRQHIAEKYPEGNQVTPSLKNKNYEEIFKAICLTILKERQLHGEMITAYKIITYKTDITKDMFFELGPESATRGHHLKIRKKDVGNTTSLRE